jgi:hypothetical protein
MRVGVMTISTSCKRIRRDAAFDNAVEAEKREERLLADALANKQLARWICVDGNMMHQHVRKIWEPDPSCRSAAA